MLLYGPPGTGKSNGIDKALGTIARALEVGGKPPPIFLKLEVTHFKDSYHGESEKKAQVGGKHCTQNICSLGNACSCFHLAALQHGDPSLMDGEEGRVVL